jgi:hypothetical protein
MASIGINVPRDGSAPPDLIRSLGATWVRIVAVPDVDLAEALRSYRAAGIRTLLVLARESGGDYRSYAERYAGLVDAVEVGNEPDVDSPSSWTLRPSELGALGRAVRVLFPTTPLVLGGLASGQPSYLDDVDLSWCDAIGLHPYLKDATAENDVPDIGDLISGYAAYGRPLVITEWGWWGDDERRGRDEVRDMVEWAARTGDVEAFLYFCLSDAMVPPFGLLREDGTDKPAAAAFRVEAPSAIHSLWPAVPSGRADTGGNPDPVPVPVDPAPIIQEVAPMPALTQCLQRIWQAVVPLPYDETIATFGIPSYWREHLAELGSPVGEEVDDDEHEGCRLQPFALGVLRWHPDGTIERAA